ncbi:MAG: hypothetical protein K0R54_4889 [Clostridiaceae bacterium]|jgi:hypothetical protein|nr:hypothetical protein [Clostridiaceae bacterium]
MDSDILIEKPSEYSEVKIQYADKLKGIHN